MTTVGNQCFLLKLIQFANRSELENAGLISSLSKLVFELLQSSQEVFCSHVQVLFLQFSESCNRNGKYLSPLQCKSQAEGAMACPVSWCLTGAAEKQTELPCSDPKPAPCHILGTSRLFLCAFPIPWEKKKTTLEYQRSLAQRQHVS